MHFGYSLHSAFNQEVGITRYNSYKFDDLFRYVPIDWSADPGGNYFFLDYRKPVFYRFLAVGTIFYFFTKESNYCYFSLFSSWSFILGPRCYRMLDRSLT
jgi:hypothetical protein